MAGERITLRRPPATLQEASARRAEITAQQQQVNSIDYARGINQAVTQRTIEAIRRASGFPLEAAVRPAVPAKAYALLERLLAKRRKPGEESEASITWGQASDFTVEELKPPELPKLRGIKVVNPDTGDVGEDPSAGLMLTYNEVSRSTHVTRITNPEDDQQYVDVEVIDSITFQRSSDGAYIRFVLDNPN
jgi:hypothetical protein